jgi:hypothetical protein
MKYFHVPFLLLLCVAIPYTVAGAPLNTHAVDKLVHSITTSLEQQSATFPILATLRDGKFNLHPSEASFEVAKGVSAHVTPHAPSGPQPQTDTAEETGPGGILFYLYVAPHFPKIKATKIYLFSKEPDGPGLLYFINTNPEDARLKAAIQTCVEAQLRIAGSGQELSPTPPSAAAWPSWSRAWSCSA